MFVTSLLRLALALVALFTLKALQDALKPGGAITRPSARAAALFFSGMIAWLLLLFVFWSIVGLGMTLFGFFTSGAAVTSGFHLLDLFIDLVMITVAYRSITVFTDATDANEFFRGFGQMLLFHYEVLRSGDVFEEVEQKEMRRRYEEERQKKDDPSLPHKQDIEEHFGI